MFVASPKAVSVWDGQDFRRLVTRMSMLGDDTNDALFLATAPGEESLLMASQTELALVDLREETWRDTACRIADRRLTEDEWQRLLPDREYSPACA